MENLLTTLFIETQAASVEQLTPFQQLLGIALLWPPARKPQPVLNPEASDALEYLDQVLDQLLAPQEGKLQDGQSLQRPVPAVAQERRAYRRIPENQFVRFRLVSQPTATLAYLANLSEGGGFIRTTSMLPLDSLLTIEINEEHEARGYLVCCQARVARIAVEEHSALGPGLGIQFVDPPADVTALLNRIVNSRLRRSDETDKINEATE